MDLERKDRWGFICCERARKDNNNGKERIAGMGENNVFCKPLTALLCLDCQITRLCTVNRCKNILLQAKANSDFKNRCFLSQEHLDESNDKENSITSTFVSLIPEPCFVMCLRVVRLKRISVAGDVPFTQLCWARNSLGLGLS